MVEINHAEMRWLVEQAREKGDSVFIAGQSGIGKTEEIWE
jgi:DNA transposition AAA+ family ATPase